MIKITLTLKNGVRLPRPTKERVESWNHEAGLGVAAEVKKNFRARSSKVGSRHYWKRAHDLTQVRQENGKTAVVIAGPRGVRLHYYGGTVRPSGRPSAVTGRPTRSLLVPLPSSPMAKRGETLAESLRKMPGYEVRMVPALAPGRGCPCLVAVKQGKQNEKYIWLGRLVKQTKHKPDKTVLPDPAVMRKSAMMAVWERMKTNLAEDAATTTKP